MGFLSNLAKRVINKDDDEAAEILRRNTLPPPPRRPAPIEDVPMPITPMAPPTTRVPAVNVGEAPPPLSPQESAIATMEEILRNQPQPNLSNASVGPNGEITGARYPATVAPLPPPTIRTMPTEGMAPPGPATGPVMPPPLPRELLSESYAGMTPAQKAALRLRLLQENPAESKIKDTGEGYAIQAPQRMSRKEGALRGLGSLIGVGAQHGVGGMIGAGLFGLGLGAISPGTIQDMSRRREIAGAQAEYGRNLGLETEATQNDTRRLANLTSLARLEDADQDRELNIDREGRLEYQQGLSNIEEWQKRADLLDPKSAEYKAATDAIQAEAERLSKRTGRKITVIPGNPKLNKLPRLVDDGQIIQQQYDGTWRPVFGGSRSDAEAENADLKANYEWQKTNAENEAKRTAATQEANDLIATAENHQQKVTTLAGQISVLDAQMAKMFPRDPALGPLKRQREQLKQQQANEERGMNDAYEKARAKQAEAAKYPTMPPPPKRVRRASAATGTNQGVSLSKSAWLKSHPGGDWQAAEAEANRRQIPIIP